MTPSPEKKPSASARDAPRPFTQEDMDEAIALDENYRAQLSALEEQRGMLAQVASDYARGLDSLEALASADEGEEVLVPLGGGAFVHARLASKDRVLSSIGGGVHVEGGVADAKRRLEERVASAEKAMERTNAEAKRIVAELEALAEHVQNATGAAPPSKK
ncbi:MAG: prefoldin subunit alpha [Thermoplasmatota archaeon]